MTKIFTPNDVIRYFYNEVSVYERQEIETALLWDNDLAEYHQELIQLEGALNKIKKEPSQRVIENILNYSKSFSLHTA
jgi:hypothetical protein